MCCGDNMWVVKILVFNTSSEFEAEVNILSTNYPLISLVLTE